MSTSFTQRKRVSLLEWGRYGFTVKKVATKAFSTVFVVLFVMSFDKCKLLIFVLMFVQVAHVKAERDFLAESDNDWVVKLYYSFQVSVLCFRRGK